MVWKPHVTVSAVIERDGRFLMVEELVEDRAVFNQPAGHLDEDESLVEAVVREVLEETAWEFAPEHVTGLYLWKSASGRTFLRVNFFGHGLRHHAERELDDGILRAVWMTRDELHAEADRLRSPMVLRCIDDHLDGRRYPLDVLTHLETDH